MLRSRLSDMPAYDHSLCRATDTEAHLQQAYLANDNDRLIENPKPIVPKGGFLQVAVSEAPIHSISTPVLRSGRSRYSPKTSQYQSGLGEWFGDLAPMQSHQFSS